MPLALVRVDSRLVHGQVVEGWVPHVKANCLLVVNDDLASNPFLRSVMELAGNPSLRIVFCRLDDVASAMELAGSARRLIKLEITEGAILDNSNEVLAIRAAGANPEGALLQP